jgi:hypothetical protein
LSFSLFSTAKAALMTSLLLTTLSFLIIRFWTAATVRYSASGMEKLSRTTLPAATRGFASPPPFCDDLKADFLSFLLLATDQPFPPEGIRRLLVECKSDVSSSVSASTSSTACLARLPLAWTLWPSSTLMPSNIHTIKSLYRYTVRRAARDVTFFQPIGDVELVVEHHLKGHPESLEISSR